MSNSFSISKAELISVGKGLLIAIAGAALTYLTQYVSHANFGIYTPIIVAGWSVVVNFARKYVPNTNVPSTTV